MKFTRNQLKEIFVQKTIQLLGMEEQQVTLSKLQEIMTDEDSQIMFELYEKTLEIQRQYSIELKYVSSYYVYNEMLVQQLSSLQEQLLAKAELSDFDSELEYQLIHKTNLTQINYENEEIKTIVEEMIDTMLDSEEWQEWNYKQDLLAE